MALDTNTQQDPVGVARGFFERFIGANDAAAADELVADDVVAVTGLSPNGPIVGREAYKGAVAMMWEGFPDMRLTIEDQFAAADGERVVTRINSAATHTGPMMGLEPTGQALHFIETHVTTVREGRVVENWVSATNLEFEMLFADVLRPMILPERFGSS